MGCMIVQPCGKLHGTPPPKVKRGVTLRSSRSTYEGSGGQAASRPRLALQVPG